MFASINMKNTEKSEGREEAGSIGIRALLYSTIWFLAQGFSIRKDDGANNTKNSDEASSESKNSRSVHL